MPDVTPPTDRNDRTETPAGDGPRRRWRWPLAVVTLLAATTLTVVPSAAPAAAATPTFQSGHGITVLDVTTQGRRVDLRISTPAISTSALSDDSNDVTILLPEGYNPAIDYPVLYLMHGRGGSSTDWTAGTDVEGITADRDLIVVMPEAGRAGWGTNWEHPGGGAQQWDHFHLDQLIGWVDQNLSTIQHKNGRAIAGFSMGGFIAVRAAAVRPHLFAFAGGFSAGYDLQDIRMRATIHGSELLEGFSGYGSYGWPWNSAWSFNNPWHRTAALRSVHTVLYAGTDGSLLEGQSHHMSWQFFQRLRANGADRSWFLEYADRSCGHHYGCAEEALAREIGPMMDVLWGP